VNSISNNNQQDTRYKSIGCQIEGTLLLLPSVVGQTDRQTDRQTHRGTDKQHLDKKNRRLVSKITQKL